MLKKYAARTENTAARIIEGQAVIMTMEDNTLHTLNNVGSKMWELCNGQRTIEEIIQAIQDEYTISREEAKADCESFIHELCIKGILTLRDEKVKNAVDNDQV